MIRMTHRIILKDTLNCRDEILFICMKNNAIIKQITQKSHHLLCNGGTLTHNINLLIEFQQAVFGVA